MLEDSREQLSQAFDSCVTLPAKLIHYVASKEMLVCGIGLLNIISYAPGGIACGLQGRFCTTLLGRHGLSCNRILKLSLRVLLAQVDQQVLSRG